MIVQGRCLVDGEVIVLHALMVAIDIDVTSSVKDFFKGIHAPHIGPSSVRQGRNFGYDISKLEQNDLECGPKREIECFLLMDLYIPSPLTD